MTRNHYLVTKLIVMTITSIQRNYGPDYDVLDKETLKQSPLNINIDRALRNTIIKKECTC